MHIKLMIYTGGTKEWIIERPPGSFYYPALHNDYGPATILGNGIKKWFVDGRKHRLDGPAIDYASGSTEWWVNGKLHRLDGPAIDYTHGDRKKEWYVNGMYYDNYLEYLVAVEEYNLI